MNVLIYLIDLVESNSSIKQRQECNSFKIVNSEFFLNKNAGGLDRMRPVGIKMRFVGHLQGLVYSTFLQLLFYPRKCNRGLGFGNNGLPQHTQTSCHSTSSRRCKDCYLKLFGIYNKDNHYTPHKLFYPFASSSNFLLGDVHPQKHTL